MSSTTDKIKGKVNEVAGSAKQSVGKATGDDRLTGEGALQEGKGHAQQAAGKTKDALKKMIDRT
jgi:uncharacterized protein YjbJ (UPF0337 family)